MASPRPEVGNCLPLDRSPQAPYDGYKKKGGSLELGPPTLALAVVFHLALWLEARRTPESVWAAAGYRRSVWLFYLLVIPGVLTILYLMFVRPKLRKSSHRRIRE